MIEALTRDDVGTTSACAENTEHCIGCGRCTWNYLRVCGEYPTSVQGQKLKRELPPRVRRIPRILCSGQHTIRTTSACAENTPDDALPK